MIIAGGYYNGQVTMKIPVTSLLLPNQPKPRWSTLSHLPDQRQWGPALGLVGGTPVIASGKNYGDVTMDELRNEHWWTRDSNRLQK